MSTSVSNSSLTGVTLNVTSVTPPNNVWTQPIPVASLSVGANSVQITDSSILTALQSGDTIDYSLSCSYADGKSVVSTAGTPYVPPPPPPPPPVILDTNGVTLKYTLSSIPSGQSNPYIIQVPEGSGTYYAVMNDSQDSINKITAYANLVGSNPNPTTATPSFTAPDNTPIPFNRIVTTLMTNMYVMFAHLHYFNQPIASWDTSSVTNMGYMFYNARVFNQDLRRWNVLNIPSQFAVGAAQFNNAAYALNTNYLPIWGTAGISL
jgi:surface protein